MRQLKKAPKHVRKKCYDSLPFLVTLLCPHITVPQLTEADKLLTIDDEVDIVRHVDEVLGVERTDYLTSLPRISLTPKHWSYLRISDGCDHKCAFCAIILLYR